MGCGDASEFCDIAYEQKKPREYFFDRNGDNFSSILGEQINQSEILEDYTSNFRLSFS